MCVREENPLKQQQACLGNKKKIILFSDQCKWPFFSLYVAEITAFKETAKKATEEPQRSTAQEYQLTGQLLAAQPLNLDGKKEQQE